jgi:hypothetical protein
MDRDLLAFFVALAVSRPRLRAGPGTVPGRPPGPRGRSSPWFGGLRTCGRCRARPRRERLDRVDDLGADAQLALQKDFLPGADRPVPRVRRGVPAETETAELVADLVGPGGPGDADVAAGGEFGGGGWLRGASRARGGDLCGASAQAARGAVRATRVAGSRYCSRERRRPPRELYQRCARSVATAMTGGREDPPYHDLKPSG